jgi:hypothetical protein
MNGGIRQARGWDVNNRVAAVVAVCVSAVIAAVFYVAVIRDGRSVEAYCETWAAESQRLQQRWAEQGGALQQTGNPLPALGMIAGAPRDLASLYDELEKVAPDEIQPDVVVLRDAYQQLANSMGSATDPLGFGLSGLMIGLSTMEAERRVNEYTRTHCADRREP